MCLCQRSSTLLLTSKPAVSLFGLWLYLIKVIYVGLKVSHLCHDLKGALCNYLSGKSVYLCVLVLFRASVAVGAAWRLCFPSQWPKCRSRINISEDPADCGLSTWKGLIWNIINTTGTEPAAESIKRQMQENIRRDFHLKQGSPTSDGHFQAALSLHFSTTWKVSFWMDFSLVLTINTNIQVNITFQKKTKAISYIVLKYHFSWSCSRCTVVVLLS